VPCFEAFLLNIVAIKNITNYLRKSCSALATKNVGEIDPIWKPILIMPLLVSTAFLWNSAFCGKLWHDAF
jgi:hypothetical protein